MSYELVNLQRKFQDAVSSADEDMLAETAYVKLGSALGQFSDISEVKTYMLTNIAGEISHSRMDSDFKELSL